MEFRKLVSALSNSDNSGYIKNGKHYLSPDTDFWDDYIKHINSDYYYNLIETYKPEDKSQLCMKIKMEFPQEEKLDSNTETLIDNFVYLASNLLYSVIQKKIEPSKKYLSSTVAYIKRNEVFHNNTYEARLILPYIKLPLTTIRDYFFEFKGLSAFQFENINIDPSTTTDISEIFSPLFDRSLIGSGQEHQRFLNISFFDADSQRPLNLNTQIFDPSQFKELYINEDNLEKYLPLMFTKKYGEDFETKLKVKKNDDFNESADDIFMREPETYSEYELNDQYEKITKFIDLIDVKRANNLYDWMDIGRSLAHLKEFIPKTLNDDSDIELTKEGLNLWKTFTARGNKFTPDDCDKYWSEFTADENLVTANTIQWFAYKDDQANYSRCMKPVREAALNELIKNPNSHGEVAEMFYLLYPFHFLCSNPKKDVWYWFNGTLWKPRGDIMITKYMATIFRDIFKKKQLQFTKQASETKCEITYNNLIDKIKVFTKIIQKLGDATFVKKCISFLKIKYLNADFERIKDSIQYVMAFSNCIIDVRDGGAVPRSGKPEDFCTKYSPMCYKKLYEGHPFVKEARKYMMEVFRNKERREFMWRLFASLLIGGNLDRIVPIFQGLGANSKSVIVRLLQKAFGSYVGTISTSALTEKRTGSDNATPGITRIKGTRIVFAQEPDKKDAVRSGTVKEYSGGDRLATRDLFQKGTEDSYTIPTFILGVCTNHHLHMVDADQATWDRVLLIKFTSKWVNPIKCPKSYDEQFEKGIFPKDRNFDTNFPRIAQGFIWLCCQYYEEYHRNGLQIPKCVLRDSNLQQMKNNYYISFVIENLSEVKDETAEDHIIECSVAYESFLQWFKEQNFNKSIKPDGKKMFISEMNKTLRQEQRAGVWRGWVFDRNKSDYEIAQLEESIID